MIYKVRLTNAAKRDLINATEYIECVLLNPQAADDLVNETETKLSELAYFPEKYAIVDDDVLKVWGIRYVSVGNYLIIYFLSEQENTVQIIRFLYKKRNWISIIKEGFSLE